MSKRLFVGGLPWSIDDRRLKDLFSEFDEPLEARVVMDQESGRSKGFGFVSYGSEEQARRALALAGREVDGRAIRVDLAEEKPARNQGSGRPSGRGQEAHSDPHGPRRGGPRGRRRGGRGGRGGGMGSSGGLEEG